MTRLKRPDIPRLAERLELLRSEWYGRRLDSDPLAFPHRYADPADREVAAFLAASLAFGRVASIALSLERVLAALGPAPAAFLATWDGTPISGLRRFTHRWVREADLTRLLLAIAGARRRHGSLGALFASRDAGGGDTVEALDHFYEALRDLSGPSIPSRAVRFLLPVPGDGSACKRAHLFLRWMVRTDGHDLGLWTGDRLTPARLLLPMDTHVHRIATYLGLTSRRSADLGAAREATGWLRKISPRDPVAYDWALSRLGILAECVREKTRRHCERCAVRPVCRAALTPKGWSEAEIRATA